MKKFLKAMASLATLFTLASCGPDEGTIKLKDGSTVDADYLVTAKTKDGKVLWQAVSDEPPYTSGSASESTGQKYYKIRDKVSGSSFGVTPHAEVSYTTIKPVEKDESVKYETLVTAFNSKMDTVLHMISKEDPDFSYFITATDKYTGETKGVSNNMMVSWRAVPVKK